MDRLEAGAHRQPHVHVRRVHEVSVEEGDLIYHGTAVHFEARQLSMLVNDHYLARRKDLVAVHVGKSQTVILEGLPSLFRPRAPNPPVGYIPLQVVHAPNRLSRFFYHLGQAFKELLF